MVVVMCLMLSIRYGMVPPYYHSFISSSLFYMAPHHTIYHTPQVSRYGQLPTYQCGGEDDSPNIFDNNMFTTALSIAITNHTYTYS